MKMPAAMTHFGLHGDARQAHPFGPGAQDRQHEDRHQADADERDDVRRRPELVRSRGWWVVMAYSPSFVKQGIRKVQGTNAPISPRDT